MFSLTALALLATTVIPVAEAQSGNATSHQVSPKVSGILVGCLLGLLFLGCICEGVWRKRKLRRLAARQPDPEQGSVSTAPAWTVLETDGEDGDEDAKEFESGVTDGKASVDTDDGGSISMVPVCPPPPAYTPKADKIYKPLGGGEW
ncbi:hypothetical protein EDD18DRAFT_594078 [Armillaria luteobubalina]|uniref:Transmembrane protein n=1 Tax=Armillaria luteobubalina TaxID=153913 RepID=A0AA39PQE6_9AGAR|nr:hypothetical protein EDD18DRAFT_594078 [Armillaria luteobubalina]